MNNPQLKHYSTPEVKVLFIRTDQLCTGSQTTAATREDYESIDLFE